jgi:putative endonuclease
VSDARPPPPEEATRRAAGQAAEALAEAYLVGLGFRVLERNHATRRGEVDLICQEGEVTCFVEVRSRSGLTQGSPLETVGLAKARRIVAAATDWAWRHGKLETALRFDVVAVQLGDGEPRFELVRDAFDAHGRPTG